MHRDQVSDVNCAIDIVHGDTCCETAKKCPIDPGITAHRPHTFDGLASGLRCLAKFARIVNQVAKICRLMLSLSESSTGIGESRNLFLADDNGRVRVYGCSLATPQPHNRVGPLLGIFLSKTPLDKRW